MFEKYLQVETLGIVFIGNFNPVIVQPFWLANKGLIREKEAEKASEKIEIIHNEIVRFDLDWAYVTITKDRCDFKSTQRPYFDTMRDLSTGIFKLLKETPIKSLGINHLYDFSLPNADMYYSFGNKLSPLKIWDGNLNDAKLLTLEIVEEKRYDKHNGRYRIRILPSSDQSIPFGVQININDHYDLEPVENGRNLEMIFRLEKYWQQSFQRAKDVIEKLWNKLEL
jgi:hypothetical protein